MSLWEAFNFVSSVGQSVVAAWRSDSHIDSHISNLRALLHTAQLLIERSECWRFTKYDPIDKLLPQLKDCVFEAESVIHESKYRSWKNKLEKRFPGDTFLKNWMSDFGVRVKMVIDNLQNVYDQLNNVCDNLGIPGEPNHFSKTARPNTSSFPNTKVCGRDKELKEVIKLLGVRVSSTRKRKGRNKSDLDAGQCSNQMEKKENVSVISIVGMGGVGKTTLAQMVCSAKSVKDYFDDILWVCVSENFDIERLTKEIIESATKKDCGITNLNTLQERLATILNSKRFLLVLDDVWSKDWLGLLGPMRGVGEGSIVMVTTRSHKCVELTETDIISSRGCVNLKGFEEDIYWKFFKDHAFGSEDVDPILEGIGKEICERLKGSPLAAKTVGSLLRANMDAKHWVTIKNSAMWQLRQEESDILPVLQLSYQYLPSHLKRCFSYCALYPKDFKFTKWELTKLWIMQGLINLPEKFEVYWKEPYIKEADDYFLELIKRCFFQKAASSNSQYVIHDLMHDVCQSIMKDECFCITKGDGDWEISMSSRNIRHLSIFKSGMTREERESLCKYNKLISLRLDPKLSFRNVIGKWCKTFTCISSLSLSHCDIGDELPESIGNLTHLQYLDISFTKITKLPESICDLYNLEYLNMENCLHIRSVPKAFSRLVINLRFLYWVPKKLISIVYDMEHFATALEINDLQFDLNHGNKIEMLKHINKLGGTLRIIDVENIPSKEAAEEAHLKNKSLINELYIIWNALHRLLDECRYEDVLYGLWPHPNLKAFVIYHYGGGTLPSWFKKECLPYLTEIGLQYCTRLTNLRDCLDPNQFPLLKTLDIGNCNKLVSLPVESFGGFVSLKKLAIQTCPNLPSSNAMVLPPSIEILQLRSCGGLEKSIPSCLRNLTSLKSLHIENCRGSLSIPSEITNNLKSLEVLSVHKCAELQSLGGLDFLASLKDCYISGCPKVAETRGQDVMGKLPPEIFQDSPSTSRGRN